MPIERIPIISREQWLEIRKKDITASVVGALWGLHPYQTAAQVWAEKTGILVPDSNESAVTERGRRLEPVVAEMVRERRPDWTIEKANEYIRDPAFRFGGTPDYYYTDGLGRRGVLQIKTCSTRQFEEHWEEDSAPLWITLQTLSEAYLAGAEVATIAVLVIDDHAFELKPLYDVPRHAAAEARIITTIERFWRETDRGNQPAIDPARDEALLKAMWPSHIPAKLVDLPAEAVAVLERYSRMDEAIKTAQAALKEDKNRLREWIRDAEGGFAVDSQGNEWIVTLKAQNRKAFNVDETAFRRMVVKKIDAK